MNRPLKITILKSKENLVWISMNEIIPWIERLWIAWAKDRNQTIEVIDIDEQKLSSTMSTLFSSDLVIITSFTTSMARIVWTAKEKLSLPIKCVFYLHNQATIGCWPLYEWKMAEALNTNDIFVGSCTRDKVSMDACFENANTYIHPFSLDDYSVVTRPLPKAEFAHFVFIGRISTQKNLHIVLWSLSLLKKNHPELNWKFEIFGTEDHLGSPLMGIDHNTYKAFLEELITELGLGNQVVLRGFCDRNDIQQEMETYQRIFLAPSLHSDENFGMAAFRSLRDGHKAILSDWGGHADYPFYFKELLRIVPVHESANGPFIDAKELSEIMYASAMDQTKVEKNPDYYLPEKIFKTLDQIAHSEVTAATPLLRNDLGKRIQTKRKLFLEQELKEKPREKVRGCKIFKDFADEDSLKMFRAYGMKKSTQKITRRMLIAPWAKEVSGKYVVNDPHKGEVISNKEDLLSLGYAVSLED